MTTEIKHLLHPTTAELLDGDNLPRLMQAEKETAEFLGPVYQARAILRERIAELQGPLEMPPRRYQTEKQTKVDRCPRCGLVQKDEAA